MFLLDNMSIMDNILASGYLTKKDKKTIIGYAKEMLKKVGLKEIIWKKFPNQLSGGENQRSAIVRALINNPKVVFADEPTGALNSAAGKDVLDVLTEVNNNSQSIIMVTHDINSALRGNRVLYIKDGVICGECNIGKFNETDETRRTKLQEFLTEMGW
jgi:putative ABC transport system ATP-binding protein